jgi:hypothetical protein
MILIFFPLTYVFLFSFLNINPVKPKQLMAFICLVQVKPEATPFRARLRRRYFLWLARNSAGHLVCETGVGMLSLSSPHNRRPMLS